MDNWDFSHSEINDEILKIMYDDDVLNNLRFNLSRCKNITDEGLIYLKNVSDLNLSDCQNIMGHGLKYLESANILKISFCKNISDDHLKYLSNAFDIDLSGCQNITNDGLIYLSHVTRLHISQCDNITDGGLQYLKNVNYLDISYCNKITDDGLKYLKHVTNINIAGCGQITDIGIGYLQNIEIMHAWHTNFIGTTLPSLKYLKKLSLKHINDDMLQYIYHLRDIKIDQSSITDDGLRKIQGVPKIYLYQCNKITDQGIINLMSPYPDNQDIILDGCKCVTHCITQEIVKFNPNIKISYYTRSTQCIIL